MEYRSFGKHGVQVSAIGLGTSHLNPISGPRTYAAAAAVVQYCVSRGVNFFDTADSYGAGWSERWLGRALRPHRSDVVIATKFGLAGSLGGKLLDKATRNRWLSPLGRGTGRYEPHYVAKAVRGSLQRLGTDYLDVAMIHSPPFGVLRAAEWLAPLLELRASGVVRYVGVSARTAEDASFAIRELGVDAIQLECNPCTMDRAAAAIAAARDAGTAVVARQVLGSGRLLGRLAAALPDVPRSALAASLVREVVDMPEVSSALIGMRSVAHAAANVSLGRPDPQVAARIAGALAGACAERAS